ncbi:MAG: DUF5716 family protein [Lachnospiraceae bacterium]
MKEIFLGLDLCKKSIQLSYYREDKSEPQSICQLNNTETFLFPNVMFYATQEKKWYVGNDVSGVRFTKEGTIVEDVIGNIDSDSHVVIGTSSYTYEMLLLILLKTHVQDFLSRNEDYVLKGVTVTLEEYHPVVYKVLKRFGDELDLDSEHFGIISHETAFFQFVMNQDEKIHTNSVAMFDYGHEGMDYYRIDRKNQRNTKIYYLGYESLKEDLPYLKLFSDVEELDKSFAAIAKMKMKETYVSAVYLTGPGFNDTWIQESQRVLCEGRRVFMGQNIFTKGACYHARLGAYENGNDIILCTQGSIPFDIGVTIGDLEGRNHFCPIAIGGREWYNMRGKVSLFLDDTKRISMVYRDKVTKEMQQEVIEINGLPKRPPKTTKISLEVEMYNETMGAIIIRDEGFGSIYPTTNKIYRKEFTVKM